MQTTQTLSTAAGAAESEAAATPPPTLLAQQLEQQVQAMQAQAQSQQAALRALQEQTFGAPLLGLRSDTPEGMTVDGLALGAAVLLLGAGTGWVMARLQKGRARAAAAKRRPVPTAQDFSDSMLYLSDHEHEWVAPEAVVRLHRPDVPEPPAGSEASAVRPAPVDVAEPSVTDTGPATAPRSDVLHVRDGGARVDSERAQHAEAQPGLPPGSFTPPPEPAVTQERPALGRSIFGAPVAAMDFDRHAAASEVERVRNYLAKRREARAMGLAPHVERVDPPSARSELTRASSVLGTEDTVRLARPPLEEPVARSIVQSVDLELDLDLGFDGGSEVVSAQGAQAITASAAALPESTAATAVAQAPSWDALVAQAMPAPQSQAQEPHAAVLGESAENLLDMDLDVGASLLVSLDSEERQTPQDGMAIDLDALAGDLALSTDAEPGVESTEVAVGAQEPLNLEITLGRCVQLELAQEFFDLGLIAEARERVLEVLQKPHTEFHAQAQAFLDRLPGDALPSTY